MRLAPEEAAGPIARAGLAAHHRDAWEGISPFVVASVAWSLYAFLRTPDDYWEAVLTAIAGGGDVDTTAAMTGAIAGARGGLAAVPDGLARRLNDRGTWTYDELVGLAGEAWRLKTRGRAGSGRRPMRRARAGIALALCLLAAASCVRPKWETPTSRPSNGDATPTSAGARRSARPNGRGSRTPTTGPARSTSARGRGGPSWTVTAPPSTRRAVRGVHAGARLPEGARSRRGLRLGGRGTVSGWE